VGVIVFLIAVSGFTSAFTLPFRGGPIFIDILTLAGVVGGVAVLAFLYRRRDVYGRVRVATMLAAAFAALATFGGVAPRPTEKTAPIHPVIRLAFVDSENRTTNRDLQARLTVDNAPPAAQITFTADSIELHLRDGSVVRTSGGFQSMTVHAAALPLDSGWRWLNSASSTRLFDSQGTVRFNLVLNDQARRALLRGVTDVALIGVVAVTEPYRRATMPLIAGRERTSSGMRVRIDGVNTSIDDAGVDVESVRADRDDNPLIALGTIVGPGYAIVNNAAREGMVLTTMHSQGGSGWIVLPGQTIREQSVQLQTNPSGARSSAVARDEAWYRGAELVIFGWRSTDSYTARLSAHVPAPPA
jgi:hypothetical protein